MMTIPEIVAKVMETCVLTSDQEEGIDTLLKMQDYTHQDLNVLDHLFSAVLSRRVMPANDSRIWALMLL
ncbi:MAG: hypothetical protein NW237_09785 [Cyanobacteriota bacterium]|nr:hypothetical protein [Cyanobacteriota bacterium]